jgi:hypothetical protein
MTTSDWELVASIVTPIVIAIVGATVWITKKVTAVEKDVERLDGEIDNLKGRLNTAEDDIRANNRYFVEQSQTYAAQLRDVVRSLMSGRQP